LSSLPKRCPSALEHLLLRRLTPVEVVWRPGDPPVHYTPGPISCTAPARQSDLASADPLPRGHRFCSARSRSVTGPRRELGDARGVGAKIESGGADARGLANLQRSFEGMALPLRPKPHLISINADQTWTI